MKLSNSYKSVTFTIIGIIVALLATEGYFKIFNIMGQEINLVTFMVLIAVSILMVFLSPEGLVSFAKKVLNLFVFKKK